MEIEKYTTNRGKEGIVVDGFKYRLDKSYSATHLWRCIKAKCKARCKTDLTDLMILDGRNEHNHEKEEERKIQRHNIRQACKRKAEDSITERPHKLIVHEVGKTENASLVPEDVGLIRQAVYRVRYVQ